MYVAFPNFQQSHQQEDLKHIYYKIWRLITQWCLNFLLWVAKSEQMQHWDNNRQAGAGLCQAQFKEEQAKPAVAT